MLKLENAYKEFMIKKGTDVLRFDKNGRKQPNSAWKQSATAQRRN